MTGEIDTAMPKRTLRLIVIGSIVSQLSFWALFFGEPRSDVIPSGIFDIITMMYSVTLPIFWAVQVARRARKFTWAVLGSLLYSFSATLVNFAALYWHYGTPPNFNITMSRLDSIYFALGTMTTGTGSIAPESQVARGLVSIQMILDFVFVAIAVGIAITRLGEKGSSGSDTGQMPR